MLMCNNRRLADAGRCGLRSILWWRRRLVGRSLWFRHVGRSRVTRSLGRARLDRNTAWQFQSDAEYDGDTRRHDAVAIRRSTTGRGPGVNPSNLEHMYGRNNPQDLTTPRAKKPQDAAPSGTPQIMVPER